MNGSADVCVFVLQEQSMFHHNLKGDATSVLCESVSEGLKFWIWLLSNEAQHQFNQDVHLYGSSHTHFCLSLFASVYLDILPSNHAVAVKLNICCLLCCQIYSICGLTQPNLTLQVQWCKESNTWKGLKTGSWLQFDSKMRYIFYVNEVN